MPRQSTIWVAVLLLFVATGCGHTHIVDDPRRTPGTTTQDIHFHSDILAKEIAYRVIGPTHPRRPVLPVVYLLHGAGDDYTSWSNHSSVAAFAATHDVLLVMPDAQGSLLVNTDDGKRYEDYFLQELIPNFHQHCPEAATDRSHSAIVGISRGGFSSIVLALRHPELFSFVAGISPAVDFAERPFSWRRLSLSMQLRSTFGPRGSDHRRQNDPFFLVKSAPSVPFLFFISCGSGDVLAGSAHRFIAALTTHGIATSSSFSDGAHDWTYWNSVLPDLEKDLAIHFDVSDQYGPATNGKATP